ncbi:lectin like domain-containing protein [Dethiosulfovibrio sp. F2B]|uniref:lectin like domain-containing protein n=1 Tax=Dethiosulfovibrio faecalis TaxID=2720018 RepID=UPI001F39BCEA|nr:lectin like domain-containing protein [Dethiosulfovibrio faecalis]MCF4151089.1 lectin like domain-containing protein [Dethiosulfovibrio faecalis]
MKNLVKILLCAVIVMASAVAVWADVAPLNPAFESYMERQSEEGKVAADGNVYRGRIPSPVDLSHLAGASVFDSEGKGASSFPVNYDLRTLGLVSPVRDQDPYGACWTFSATASMESTSLKAGVVDPDYAEQFLAYYGYVNQSNELVGFGNYGLYDFPDLMDNGGDDFKAIALLVRGTGAVNESEAPYGAVAPAASTVLSRSLRNVYYFYYDSSTRYQKASVENIKTALMNYGAVSVGMYAGDPQGGNWVGSPYFNPSTYASYTPSDNPDGFSLGSANHAVTVVGWDDNYSRTNFNPANQPSSDGAWIVKNSWGADWGDKGYFYLSYEDAVMDTGAAYVGSDPITYDVVYQYDPLGWCNSVTPTGMSTDTAWMANVFTARGNETIRAVSFYAGGVGNTYSISVYTGVTGDPTTGTPVVYGQTGTAQEPGYHTVELYKPVTVAAGERFSVVIHLTTPGYSFPVAVEYRIAGYTDKATASAGQSYLSSDGTSWTDATSSVDGTANVCIKAFGTESSFASYGSLKVLIEPAAVVTAGAAWSIDEGRTWYSSGTTVPSLPPGDYSVQFKQVVGWRIDSPQNMVVLNGGSGTLTGTYERSSGSSGGGGCSVGFAPAALLLGLPMLALFGRR